MKCRCPNLSAQNAEFPADSDRVIQANEKPLQADNLPGIASNAAFNRHTIELRPPPLRSPSNKQPPMPNNFAPASTPLTALSRRFSVFEVQRRPQNLGRLTPDMFQRKALAGQIKIPITRLESSQKSAKGIHLQDLANYLDEQRAAAIKECKQL